jgi:hypothetical protein
VWNGAWSHRPALPFALRYSALLLASVLVAPHLIVYDLVILAPVFLLLSDWLIGRSLVDHATIAHSTIAQQPGANSYMKVVLYSAYLAPLAGGPIARWTHLQVSVVLMSVLVWMIWRASRSSPVALAA